MESTFDLKATIAQYTANLRKAARSEALLNVLLDVPSRIDVNREMAKRNFYDSVVLSSDMRDSLAQWQTEHHEFLVGLDPLDHMHAQAVMNSVKDIHDARFEVGEGMQRINGHFGFTSDVRNKFLKAQLKHIDSVVSIAERATEGRALSDIQKDMVASHVSDLVMSDLQHMAKLSDSELKTYKFAPTTSAIFMGEFDLAFKGKGSGFMSFVTDLQKSIAAAEKPVGSPRNWIIGGVVAAVVAVGAWMLAANQKPAEHHEAPAR